VNSFPSKSTSPRFAECLIFRKARATSRMSPIAERCFSILMVVVG
jgi:hypothetical protein